MTKEEYLNKLLFKHHTTLDERLRKHYYDSYYAIKAMTEEQFQELIKLRNNINLQPLSSTVH